MIPELISREHSRQARLRAEHFTTYQKALERDNFQSVLEAYHCVNKTDPTCPNINRATLVPPGPTEKTTIPPVKTTIPSEKNTGATEEYTGSTEENTGSTKENTENSTPESLGSTKKAFDEYKEQEEEKKEAYEKLKEEDLYIPAFMSDDSENDIIASFLKFIYSSLQKEEEVCNGPSFTGFNSLTEEQVYGQLAIFLANYGKPLCPICDRLVGQIDRWFRKAHTFMADDEAYIFNLYLSKIPPKETICSILLPTCHEEYVSDETPSSDTTATPSPNTTATPSSNTTATSPKPTTTPSPKLNLTISSNTSACLACNLCMTGSTILMVTFTASWRAFKKLDAWPNG
uniref:Uncharacterized protein n=1 Tax=Acrobeloides nanus TaxID=290746 RepID=A0A914DZR4_9BILA